VITKVKTVTLALRDSLGSHTGENIKDYLLAVLREYQISDKVAYFAADNATNNDRAEYQSGKTAAALPWPHHQPC